MSKRQHLGVFWPVSLEDLLFFLSQNWKRRNLGHSIQIIFSKFGHSSEFRVFSLENIENLVLNLRPGSVY